MVAFRVDLLRAAQADLADATDWYEAQSAGLGANLVDDVDRAVARIVAQPRLYPVRIADARCARLDTFPYGVFYRIVGHRLVIFAIVHERRDPIIWHSRI